MVEVLRPFLSWIFSLFGEILCGSRLLKSRMEGGSIPQRFFSCLAKILTLKSDHLVFISIIIVFNVQIILN